MTLTRRTFGACAAALALAAPLATLAQGAYPNKPAPSPTR
jgi:hypothetical protein